ncbi:MAG: hypothetical protein ACOYXY_05760 [Thermodesulfobacteriota bacterium]
MMRSTILAGFCLVIVLAAAPWVQAQGVHHTKVHPHAIQYPLISPVPFPSAEADPFRSSFLVKRLLKGYSPSEFEMTLRETLDWHTRYGSYGVLGHGEDVFTRQAARFRLRHQGR